MYITLPIDNKKIRKDTIYAHCNDCFFAVEMKPIETNLGNFPLQKQKHDTILCTMGVNQ